MRKLLISALILATVTSASAEIDFRSDQPIDFYNHIDLNDNEIRQFFNQSCGEDQAVKDVYNNGSFECAPAGGLDTAVEVNNTLIKNIDANGYQITNLADPASVTGDSAARWKDVVSIEGDTLKGNLNLNGYNISDVDTLKFQSGFSINGSLNTSGGNVNLDNGSISDVYAIDGGGDEIDVLDPVDLNGNQLRNSEGRLEIDGAVYLPSGNLDMAGNNLINPGNVDGVDLDNPAESLTIKNNRYQIIASSIGNNKLNNSQRITVDGLTSTANINATGNILKEVNSVEGSGNLTLRSEASNGVVLEKEDGTQILTAGTANEEVAIPNGDLDIENNGLTIRGGDGTDYTLGQFGNGIEISRQGSGNSELNIEPGVTELGSSKIEIVRGNLDLQGNSIVDSTSSNSIPIGDGTDDSVTINAGGTGQYTVNTGDNSGSTKKRLQITADSSKSDIDIQNANLDLNSNKIKNYYGSACPSGETVVNINNDGTFDCVSIANDVSDVYVNRSGDSLKGNLDMRGNELQDVGKAGINTANPQEDLDVDGTASVQNAGTEMKVDSNGNVVVSLGQ
ncbi:hypothetical protein [Candidatus Nanohalobium constans]|uniref:Uncharacterized protein n=1 Tax=Candidatus Nanohalobium constans TaxID=2565781 RepID=A0A5Q0UFF5_9ARCH|nr:hypothetical protein [Candidatus Nanohalobium constans]QGA80317.1 hypothetical protein LC1Nh_0416 [Candidatus Nanohalobium constans]